MGNYLNPGNEKFRRMIQSEIYVDKTGMIKYTNSVLDTAQNYVCVSRPRRFGKSMAANMLTAYYSRGCDSKKLFHSFEIAKDKDFEKYLNQYNTIFLNMQEFLSRSYNVEKLIERVKKLVIRDLKMEYPEVDYFDDTDLIECMQDIYAQMQYPFVVIIDEWDCIFREYKQDKEAQEKYLDFLRDLLKDKACIYLSYMTGILPIKKYGTHSALNMFDEYSMTNQYALAESTGFTEREVRQLCECYQMSFEQTKDWYDGYNVNGVSIYNPRSVTSAMMNRVFDSYWTQTETYEALKMYIVRNENGLRDKIIRMIAGEHISINTKTFQNDMCTFETADDILTLLVHLGYLTYDFDTKTAWIPNKEVRQEFLNSIQGQEFQTVNNAIHRSDKLLQLTLAQNAEKVAEMLQEVHSENCSVIQYNDENSLACVLSLAYYSAQDSYAIYRELQGGEGFADLVFIPRTGNHNPAMIVELKWNQTTGIALEQIKDRKYIRCLKDYYGKVLFVGVNYDKKSKKHTCQFEMVEI